MLRDAVKQSQVSGYAFLDSVGTPGTAAVGIAFPQENPIAAIGVAAISSRLGPDRHAAVAVIIRKQVDAINTRPKAALLRGDSP